MIRIVVLIVAALAGLVVVQSLLLHNALELKQQTFRRNALAALNDAVVRLETGEVRGEVRRFVLNTELDGAESAPQVAEFIFAAVDSATAAGAGLCSGDAGTVMVGDSLGARVIVSRAEGLHTFEGSTPADRRDLVEQILLNLNTREGQPIADRLSPARVDSMLAHSLGAVGIEADYAFAVADASADSLVILSDPARAAELRASPLRVGLFPATLLSPFYELVVHFPDSRQIVWRQLLPLTAATAVFMLIIIGCFVYSIRTIRAQRRFSDRMIAFVNNMTHEFKTPISTVALAAEALDRPEVRADGEKVGRYRRMIGEENARMHRQVEKILQMASLEKGDFELNLHPVDLHELLAGAVAAFALQVEHRGGSLTTEAAAGAAMVSADAVHLGNVVHNLLDNAVKYSPEVPRIEVATRRAGDRIELTVRDHGMGIDAADQARVFERYYRCATGNRHDVKGFGLGLSYVQLIVGAHGGHVSLSSRPGKGTTVTVELPLAAAEV